MVRRDGTSCRRARSLRKVGRRGHEGDGWVPGGHERQDRTGSAWRRQARQACRACLLRPAPRRRPARWAGDQTASAAQHRGGGARSCSLGGAGRAHAATLARERHELVRSACTATHLREAVVEDAAVEVAPDGLAGRSPPAAVASLETLLPLVAHLAVDRLHQAIEWRRAGLTRAVEGARWQGHETTRCVNGRGLISYQTALAPRAADLVGSLTPPRARSCLRARPARG